MKRKIILLIGIMAVLTAAARMQFRTAELQRLAGVLPLDTQTLTEGYNHPVVHGRMLTVRVSGQTIDHIGLQLFSDELRLLESSPILDFLERYFLQLKFPPAFKTASNMIRDDELCFLTGTLATINDVRPSDGFSYSCDKHRYLATWNRDERVLLSVSFPVEYGLISGENKIEAEDHLLDDILKASLDHRKDKPAQDEHYLNDSFVSRLYYAGGELISDSRHPVETVANMMLSTKALGDYAMQITQICYGFQKKVFQVPLRQWIAFCKDNGCQLYFGVEGFGSHGEVNAVVLAVNHAENYNHVLSFSVPTDVIESRQGVIDARLYPYVPMHNVKSMFAAYRKSNPKTFVSK